MTHPYDTQLAWRFNPSDTLRSMINFFCNVAEDHITSANPSQSSVDSLNVAINELLGNFEVFKSTIDKLDKNIDDDAYNAIHNCFAGALLATSKIANFATLSDDHSKMFGAKIEAAGKRMSILGGSARGLQKTEEAEKWRLKFIEFANECRAEKPKCSSSEIREWILKRQNKPEYTGIRFPNLDQVKKFMETSGPEGGKDYITRKK